VGKVASDEELALLRDRLRPPPPPAPPPQTLESMRAETLSRLEPVLKESWPGDTAPLVGYEIGFTPEDVVVRIRYESRRPMDTSVEEVLTKLFESRLQVRPKQERPSAKKNAALKSAAIPASATSDFDCAIIGPASCSSLRRIR
jgi:hypothetical protein